jgi:hypothetical protein
LTEIRLECERREGLSQESAGVEKCEKGSEPLPRWAHQRTLRKEVDFRQRVRTRWELQEELNP